MGCRYCYAAYTHELMGFATPEQFHSTVFVRVGGGEETARRLAAIVRRGAHLALGTTTDPYQLARPRCASRGAFSSWSSRTAACVSNGCSATCAGSTGSSRTRGLEPSRSCERTPPRLWP